MEGECCSTSGSPLPPPPAARRGAAAAAAAAAAGKERTYRGVRMRKWGKWVAEIREPNKRSRIWLGSYSTAVAAARAYDTAVYYLRGRSARLNFPDEIAAAVEEGAEPGADALSAASIRKKATEVGARVDAIEAGLVKSNKQQQHRRSSPNRAGKNPDLNRPPSPDSSDEE